MIVNGTLFPKLILFSVIIHWSILQSISFSLNNFNGIKVNRIVDGQEIDLYSDFLKNNENEKGSTLLILGTYAADFNAIEYVQRARLLANSFSNITSFTR